MIKIFEEESVIELEKRPDCPIEINKTAIPNYYAENVNQGRQKPIAEENYIAIVDREIQIYYMHSDHIGEWD